MYFINVLFAILPGLSMIFIIITIHECGHWLAAKKAKIPVKLFSIGIGKSIWSFFNKNGEEIRIAWLPIGGYVQLDQAVYKDASPKHKIGILLAGPFANFLFSLGIFFFLWTWGGQTVIYPKIKEMLLQEKLIPPPSLFVQNVLEGFPASHCLKAGDKIIAINGSTEFVKNPSKFVQYLSSLENSLVKIEYERATVFDSCSLNLERPHQTDKLQNPRLGIEILPSMIKSPSLLLKPFSAIKCALVEFQAIINHFWSALLKTKSSSQLKLVGPIEIGRISSSYLRESFFSYLRYTSMISFIVGAMNLLPIPVLDGGQILFCLIEWGRGKALPEKYMVFIFQIGYLIMGVLFFKAIASDLFSLFYSLS